MSFVAERTRIAEPRQFVDGPIDGVVLKPLKPNVDARGWLVELYREDELPAEQHPAMAYVSLTLPGVVRGPHEHVQQTDYFAFVGPGEFTLYLWDTRINSPTSGRRMRIVVGEANEQAVLVPPGVVHAYKNTGHEPGLVFNGPNRLYAGERKREPVDEIRHESREDTLYRVD